MLQSRLSSHLRGCSIVLRSAWTAVHSLSSPLSIGRGWLGCFALRTTTALRIALIVFLTVALLALTAVKDIQLPHSPPTELTQLAAVASASASVQSSHPFHPPYDLQRSRLDVFAELVDVYLRPWTPLPGRPASISVRMLDTMESIYRGAAFRVRIVNSTVLYRHTVWWVQTYRLERMNWWLRFLQSLLDSGRIAGSLDAVLSMSDAPRVGSDSLSQGKEGSAGFPLFTMHTSIGHIDIPIVDSVVFGSNGNYVWDDEAKAVPWADKQAVAIFRGSASCFMMHVDNWHSCPRVIAAQLARLHPQQLDIAVTKWNQVSKLSLLYPPPTEAEVEATTNLSLAQPMSFTEQAHYKYVLDLDGGSGSSRKPVTHTTQRLSTQRCSSNSVLSSHHMLL